MKKYRLVQKLLFDIPKNNSYIQKIIVIDISFQQYAKDITIAAWTFLPRLEREFFCKRWNEEYPTDSDNLRIVLDYMFWYRFVNVVRDVRIRTYERTLKLNLCTTEIELVDTKRYLINCLKDPTVGLVAMGKSNKSTPHHIKSFRDLEE